MYAAATYLANKPDGATLACLVVALALFVVAGCFAAFVKAFYATVLCAGFAFLVLAFLVH